MTVENKMYVTNKKRKPKKKDGYHIILCIIKACNEEFHVDASFLDLSGERYNDFFKQCIEVGFIRRIKEGPYLAENFNITLEGIKFINKTKAKLSAELKAMLGIFEAGLKINK